VSYIRDGIAYNSEDEANLADAIPAAYLDRPTDAGYIAEAILDSDWLKEHDRYLVRLVTSRLKYPGVLDAIRWVK